jgi:hypothetical protein
LILFAMILVSPTYSVASAWTDSNNY